jgi:hypothetical protein
MHVLGEHIHACLITYACAYLYVCVCVCFCVEVVSSIAALSVGKVRKCASYAVYSANKYVMCILVCTHTFTKR